MFRRSTSPGTPVHLKVGGSSNRITQGNLLIIFQILAAVDIVAGREAFLTRFRASICQQVPPAVPFSILSLQFSCLDHFCFIGDVVETYFCLFF